MLTITIIGSFSISFSEKEDFKVTIDSGFDSGDKRLVGSLSSKKEENDKKEAQSSSFWPVMETSAASYIPK